ncbi:MAG: serine/threonine protein kinase, partial [Candidatus Obscuribacterales bacterium]|nr:serine/threonine protein kinase [Candidatus Obscuribacterales bacterium]
MANEFDDVKEKELETRLKEVCDDGTLFRGVDEGKRPEAGGIQAISASQQSVIGSTLAGNIYVEEMIGKGGMSSVYKGRHTQIDRPVAIKIMHEHLVSEENALLRFQKEAQAAGKLDHPNVVKVADFRVGENGRSFLVMDYVPGISLSEAIAKQGVLSKDAALDLFSQACDALSHAHENGVVHRDLKPSNIMLVESADGGTQVKLLDFGIAKILPQHGGSGQKLTQTGEVFGSPLYMSPEQCMGKPLDLRSDIYSMGCLMYEALAGKPPIVGANTFETFFKHTTEMPASLRTHRADLDSVLQFDALILKAMAKNPSDRYQSMAQMKADLLRIGTIKEKNILQKARENVELQRRKGSARKSRLPLYAIAVACLLVLVVSFAGSGIFSKHQNWQELYVEGQEHFDRGEYEKAQSDFKQALSVSLTDSLEQKAIFRELVDLSRVADGVPGKEYENALAAAEDADFSEIDHELSGLLSRFKSSLKSNDNNRVESDSIAHEINDKAVRLIYGSSIERARA